MFLRRAHQVSYSIHVNLMFAADIHLNQNGLSFSLTMDEYSFFGHNCVSFYYQVMAQGKVMAVLDKQGVRNYVCQLVKANLLLKSLKGEQFNVYNFFPFCPEMENMRCYDGG